MKQRGSGCRGMMGGDFRPGVTRPLTGFFLGLFGLEFLKSATWSEETSSPQETPPSSASSPRARRVHCGTSGASVREQCTPPSVTCTNTQIHTQVAGATSSCVLRGWGEFWIKLEVFK